MKKYKIFYCLLIERLLLKNKSRVKTLRGDIMYFKIYSENLYKYSSEILTSIITILYKYIFKTSFSYIIKRKYF